MQASHLITILLLAVSCNLDNVGVGIAYGARGGGIPLTSNLMIALITAGGTGLCIIFGDQVFQVLPSQIAIILGAACLIGMGVWVIWQEMEGHNPKDQETTLSNDAQDLHKESLARRMLLIF
jgi:putative sporulation protein YtaF